MSDYHLNEDGYCTKCNRDRSADDWRSPCPSCNATPAVPDRTHSANEPWTTMGYVRDDLKQARAVLKSDSFPIVDKVVIGLRHVETALARIGDGTRGGE